MTNIKRIAIVCMYPFPIGLAATNRIIAYSKGLIANGSRVDVFIMNPSDRNGITKYSHKGVYEGINYIYPNGRKRSKYFLIHGVEMILGVISTAYQLSKLHKQNKFDALIISNDRPIILYIFTRLASSIKLKSIFIFDEYPLVMRKRNKNKLNRYSQKKYDYILSKVSGMVSIIDKLLDVYNCNIKKPYIVLSTITDISKYNYSNGLKNSNQNYLCYMGSLDLSKDNVDLIIESFDLIKDKHPDIVLFIYGNASKTDQTRLKVLIEKLKLEDKVFLKGNIASVDVPSILMNARLLVTSQTNSARIEGGLSTKLGEYLASGTPCLLSDVGQISRYVMNNKHVFLVKPDSSDEYAKALDNILSNYEDAMLVAQNGRKYLIDHFSHYTMGKKLIDFIASI